MNALDVFCFVKGDYILCLFSNLISSSGLPTLYMLNTLTRLVCLGKVMFENEKIKIANTNIYKRRVKKELEFLNSSFLINLLFNNKCTKSERKQAKFFNNVSFKLENKMQQPSRFNIAILKRKENKYFYMSHSLTHNKTKCLYLSIS